MSERWSQRGSVSVCGGEIGPETKREKRWKKQRRVQNTLRGTIRGQKEGRKEKRCDSVCVTEGRHERGEVVCAGPSVPVTCVKTS